MTFASVMVLLVTVMRTRIVPPRPSPVPSHTPSRMVVPIVLSLTVHAVIAISIRIDAITIHVADNFVFIISLINI